MERGLNSPETKDAISKQFGRTLPEFAPRPRNAADLEPKPYGIDWYEPDVGYLRLKAYRNGPSVVEYRLDQLAIARRELEYSLFEEPRYLQRARLEFQEKSDIFGYSADFTRGDYDESPIQKSASVYVHSEMPDGGRIRIASVFEHDGVLHHADIALGTRDQIVATEFEIRENLAKLDREKQETLFHRYLSAFPGASIDVASWPIVRIMDIRAGRFVSSSGVQFADEEGHATFTEMQGYKVNISEAGSSLQVVAVNMHGGAERSFEFPRKLSGIDEHILADSKDGWFSIRESFPLSLTEKP